MESGMAENSLGTGGNTSTSSVKCLWYHPV